MRSQRKGVYTHQLWRVRKVFDFGRRDAASVTEKYDKLETKVIQQDLGIPTVSARGLFRSLAAGLATRKIEFLSVFGNVGMCVCARLFIFEK